MMTKKTSARQAKRPKTAAARSAGSSRAQQVLREGWKGALGALSKAEAEVETQVRRLLRNNKINVEDAAELLREFRKSVDKERKRGMKELEGRLEELRERVRKEGRNVAKMADEAVQSGLAALNIPSRREVALLTRRVEELSRRIGTLRRSKR